MEQRTFQPTITEMEASAGKSPATPAVPAADTTTPTPEATPATDPVPEGDTPPVEDKPIEGTPEEPVDEPVDFWKEVDALTGEPLAVTDNYFEGVEPNTPEWVALRDKAIEDRGVSKWDRYLEQKAPRAYAYLLHSLEGGSEESFFETKIPQLPAYDVFKNDIDLQRDVYHRDLLNRGVDSDDAKAIVDTALKNNTLFSKADTIYKKTEGAIQKQLDDVKLAADQREQQMKQATMQAISQVNTSVASNKNITIPEADRAAFSAFVAENMREQDGKFYVVNEIGKENLDALTAAMYFMFKGANLDSMIKRKATTLFTGQIKKQVDNAKQNAPSSTAPVKKFTPAGSI